MKRCFKCLCEKPIDDFYKHGRMKDGRLSKCKECTKRDVNKHRQENLEKIRAYDKMRGSMPHRVAARKEYAQTAEGKASHARSLRNMRDKYPNKYKARNLLGNAVRDGRLKKQPCMVCGEKAVAHHPDYTRPLDVVWLCQPHHKQAHALVSNSEQMKDAA